MIRRAFALALLLAVAAGGPAQASHGTQDFVATGGVLLPTPSVNSTLFTCDTGSSLQGRTHYWIPLPDGSNGHAFTAVSGSPDDDIEIHFRSPGCIPIAVSDTTGDESGTVPLRAAWARIELTLGFDATFTLTIVDVLP